MHAYMSLYCSCWIVCLFVNAFVGTRLLRGPQQLLYLLCLCWLLWPRQVTLISHLILLCTSVFLVVCMIGGFTFSKYMLCLVHLVVCSHPEPRLGNFLAMLSYYQNLAAVSFWLWWFVKPWKLTTSMKHLGGLNLAWWLNGMWTATQEQRDL